MAQILSDFSQYLLAFLDGFFFWIGTAMLIADLLGRAWPKFKKRIASRLPSWTFATAAIVCFFLASFQVWREQHDKVEGQITYFRLGRTYSLPDTRNHNPFFSTLYPIFFNIGYKNVGSFRADKIASQVLLVAVDVSAMNDSNRAAVKADAEEKVWNYFLAHLAAHPGSGSLEPGGLDGRQPTSRGI